MSNLQTIAMTNGATGETAGAETAQSAMRCLVNKF